MPAASYRRLNTDIRLLIQPSTCLAKKNTLSKADDIHGGISQFWKRTQGMREGFQPKQFQLYTVGVSESYETDCEISVDCESITVTYGKLTKLLSPEQWQNKPKQNVLSPEKEKPM